MKDTDNNNLTTAISTLRYIQPTNFAHLHIRTCTEMRCIASKTLRNQKFLHIHWTEQSKAQQNAILIRIDILLQHDTLTYNCTFIYRRCIHTYTHIVFAYKQYKIMSTDPNKAHTHTHTYTYIYMYTHAYKCNAVCPCLLVYSKFGYYYNAMPSNSYRKFVLNSFYAVLLRWLLFTVSCFFRILQ